MRSSIIYISLVFLMLLAGNNCSGSGSPCKKACEFSQKCEEKQCPTCVYPEEKTEECLFFCDGFIVVPCTEKLDAYIEGCKESNWCEDSNNCKNYIEELCDMELDLLDCLSDSGGSCEKLNNCGFNRDSLDEKYKCEECFFCD
ncbi:MAG: hypothetical protein PHE84_12490 [bacterium]|nr:hypothetical protein [bacterium]